MDTTEDFLMAVPKTESPGRAHNALHSQQGHTDAGNAVNISAPAHGKYPKGLLCSLATTEPLAKQNYDGRPNRGYNAPPLAGRFSYALQIRTKPQGGY